MKNQEIIITKNLDKYHLDKETKFTAWVIDYLTNKITIIRKNEEDREVRCYVDMSDVIFC